MAEVTDMMYVFGDAHIRNGTGEAAALMESVVRDYILNLLNEAATAVFRSGSSRITTEHIAFQVRHDPTKLNNLKEFLKWKEIRKNFAPDEGSGTSKAAVTKIKVDPKKGSKALTHWSWEIMHDLVAPGDPLGAEEDDADLLDDDILTKPEFDSRNKERLRQADEMTKNMSKEEYMKYTEARKASFTYKKAKKFRDWLGPSISALKLHDDVIEVLGYLAWEMVGAITQLGLSIKKEAEAHKTGYGSWRHKGGSILSLRLTPYQKDSEKAPLQPLHVREAVRRMQHLRYSAVGFTASHLRKERFV